MNKYIKKEPKKNGRPKKKNPQGRKTVFTDDLIQKLEYAFSIGASDSEACFYADISNTSLYNFQKENPLFLERKNRLKEKPILKARQELVKGLQDNPELSLKFLERKRKKEFSLRVENETDLNIKGIENILLQIDGKTKNLIDE